MSRSNNGSATKWKSTQVHKNDSRVLKEIVCPQLQHSLPNSKQPLEATSAQELFIESFMKWVSMAEHHAQCQASAGVV
jgi:hypothetical protein